MYRIKFILLFFGLILPCLIFGQEQLKHEKKIFLSPAGRMYINKSLPLYFYLSTEDAPTAKKYRLESEKNKEQVNPLKMTVEGQNMIRATTINNQSINFDVFVDGNVPICRGDITGATKFEDKGKITYGKGLKIVIDAKDDNSGIETIFYSLDGIAFAPYKTEILVEKEGSHVIKYYAVDNVGNANEVKFVEFSIDLTPPVSTLDVEGDKVENTLSPKSKIILNRTDNLSGSVKTMYSIDAEQPKTYVSPILCTELKDGNHKITYYSVDNVGNTEAITEKNTYNFYLDRLMPEVEIVLEGVQYNSASNLFINGETKIKVVSSDNFSGVDKITYMIKGTNPSVQFNEVPPTIYTAPFTLTQKGPQRIIVQATDKIGNSRQKQIDVYLDNEPQNTGIRFGKPQYFNQDESILCISSKTLISLFMTQFDSGIKETKYSFDGGPEMVYTKPFSLDKEGKHKTSYYTIDNVDNKEKIKNSWVIVDNTPPSVEIRFPTQPTKKETGGKMYDVYPPRSRLYIDTKDNFSGVKDVIFTINGTTPKNYNEISSAVMEELFTEEQVYKIEVRVTDKLDNEGVRSFEFVIKK